MDGRTFHHFPDLPEELRREIWEWTFEPRLIPLHCEFQHVDEKDPPPFVHQVTYQPFFGTLPQAHPSPRSTSPPCTRRQKKSSRLGTMAPFWSAFLMVEENFPTLPASVVCRESREWAGLDGYVSMRMYNGERLIRNIMWNPKHDIINFDLEYNKANLMGALPILSIFAKQFPYETTELRYLSLPTRFWPVRMHNARQITWSLMDYISLREVTVVVDSDYEKERVAEFDEETKYLSPSLFWSLPDDLEENIQAIREHCEIWAPERNPLPKKPSVRVVVSTDGIFDGEDRHIKLRCKPCPALGL